jgi:hypothetical protein
MHTGNSSTSFPFLGEDTLLIKPLYMRALVDQATQEDMDRGDTVNAENYCLNNHSSSRPISRNLIYLLGGSVINLFHTPQLKSFMAGITW